MQTQDKTEIGNKIPSAHAENKRKIKSTCENKLSTKCMPKQKRNSKISSNLTKGKNACKIRKNDTFSWKPTKQQEPGKKREQKQEKVRISRESMKQKKNSIIAGNSEEAKKYSKRAVLIAQFI